MELVKIQGTRAETPEYWTEAVMYDFDRGLPSMANELSKTQPKYNETIPKAARCENLRRQCESDAARLRDTLIKVECESIEAKGFFKQTAARGLCAEVPNTNSATREITFA